MAGQADAWRKLGWHLLAVVRHVADLARGKPQAHADVGQQEGNEKQGQIGQRPGREAYEKMRCFKGTLYGCERKSPGLARYGDDWAGPLQRPHHRKIGRATVGKEGVSTCRSRWSTDN